jgi:hypothetical protein
MGQWYVAVGQANIRRGRTQSGDVRDQEFTIQIGLTRKASYVPYDRLGAESDQPVSSDPSTASNGAIVGQVWPGIVDMADNIAGLIEEDWDTMNYANGYIAGYSATANGFTEPFHQVSIGSVEDKPASWTHSDGDTRRGEIEFISVTASGARRMRVRGTLQ